MVSCCAVVVVVGVVVGVEHWSPAAYRVFFYFDLRVVLIPFDKEECHDNVYEHIEIQQFDRLKGCPGVQLQPTLIELRAQTGSPIDRLRENQRMSQRNLCLEFL